MTYNASDNTLSTTLGSTLSPGTYPITIRAFDNAGNWNTTTTSLTVTTSTQTIGYPTPGPLLDTSDANIMNGTKYTVPSVGGTATNMSVYVGPIDTAPHNQYQLSIYTVKPNGKPGTLVAQTAVGTLTPNTWNTLPLPSGITLTPNTQYWLMYNTNATQSTLNNMYYTHDEQGIGVYTGRTFGTWPTTYPTSPTMTDQKFSLTLNYTPSSPIPPAPTPLAGNNTVESNQDSNTAGKAEAFQYTATTSGTANGVQVYLNGTNQASQVVVGLYTDNNGKPGTLLGQTTITTPVNGTWNTATLPTGVSITSGTNYWLAVLGPKSQGTIGFRDKASGGVGSHTSSQSNLTSLPATWSDGTSYATSSVSGFVY
jgi:hypothetical protein